SSSGSTPSGRRSSASARKNWNSDPRLSGPLASCTSAGTMRLSFIIPAHNEALLIGGTVSAVHAAMKGLDAAYDVIVACDGCTDDTAALAAQNGATVVEHGRRQIAATRNLGARAATGDAFIFVDGDTQVNRKAVEETIKLLHKGYIGGGAP